MNKVLNGRVLKAAAQNVTAVMLIVALVGCSVSMTPVAAKVTRAAIEKTVSLAITEEMDNLEDANSSEFIDDPEALASYSETLAAVDNLQTQARGAGVSVGELVVGETKGEEQGEEYLDFCYNVTTATTDDGAVLDSAKVLLSYEKYDELMAEVEKTKEDMYEDAVAKAFPRGTIDDLTDAEREAFMKDLNAMITKAVVLLVAGIVYACIPTAIVWGKITAACAVSIAAGVLASSILSIVSYNSTGGAENEENEDSFEQWLASVTKEPSAGYAMAASIIALGSSLNRSPVVTGIIICVFAIYNVWDDTTKLLENYKITF